MLWYGLGLILGIHFILESRQFREYNRGDLALLSFTVGVTMIARSAYMLTTV
jgi:hypothetical protein